MHPDWTSIEYLKAGNERQKQAYHILQDIRVLEVLKLYYPVLAGTIPIEIDLPESDLDIICEAYDLKEFQQLINRHYSHFNNFTETIGIEYYVANMCHSNIHIEIFAQPVPTLKQHAYRHMQIEYRLLNVLGESFRKQIIQLKKEGLKTEPAFGKLLGLQENSYEELLQFESYSDNDLLSFALQKQV